MTFGAIRTNKMSFGLNWTTMGGVFVFDQMLLPMFHAGPVSLKISYFVLLLWLISKLVESPASRPQSFPKRDFYIFALSMAVILGTGLIGELWLSTTQTNVVHTEVFRISAFYLLTVLAFGLGLQSSRFNFNWLVWLFYSSVILTLLFIVFRSQLPGWLTSFYYPELAVKDMSGFDHIRSVSDLIELSRPLGLFGNPNISSHMINLNALMIYLALRKGLLRTSGVLGLGVVVFPLILAAMFASRGEFIVAVILGISNYRIMSKLNGQASGLRKILTAFIVVFSLFVAYIVAQEDEGIRSNIERIGLLIDVVSESEKVRTDQAMDEDVYEGAIGSSRYFLFLRAGAIERWLHSPFLGTGFGNASHFPFNAETRYYHNDWARLFVTSGLLGFSIIIVLLHRFAWPLGWPVLIPWIFPGLINSFMLVYPAFMFYWFMLGVFNQKTRLNQAS